MPNNKKKKKAAKEKTTPENEYSKAVKWSQSKSVNPKALAKKLPDTAAKLRDGSFDPNKLATQLAMSKLGPNTGDFKLKPKKVRPGANPRDLEMTHEEALYMTLVQSVPLSGDNDSYEFYIDLHTVHQTTVMEAVHMSGKITEDAEKTMDALHSAFQDVGRKWESKILRTTKKKLEYTSPFYKVDIDTFFKKLFEHMTANFNMDDPEVVQDIRSTLDQADRVETTYRKVQSAAKGIVDQEDQIRNFCWECNRSTLELGLPNLMCCTRCSMAAYCGRDCQVAAWKSGHKKACLRLGEISAQIKADRRRIKQAIIDEQVFIESFVAKSGGNSTTCWLKPTPMWDYTTTSMTALGPLPEGVLPAKAKGPSMDIFYRNMASLACGGSLALFQNENVKFTDDFIGFQTFDRDELFTKRRMKEINTSEMLMIGVALSFLAYDLGGVTDENEIDQFIAHAKSSFPSGKLIPLRRMIEIYGLQSNMPEMNDMGNEHKYEVDTKTYKQLRAQYHKF
mmetsp:Transcript_1200/g.1831  ORF Transcript_1200/g.1831 Transcript_1200/m.1831 type:complete len:507 (+) Transcript_1200:81-1601(+)|eukprot:CAMPEP_0194204492 /NCGR_PEP_ID=MMETSP0156-20130528/4003_1 /TAXON_ID=33649 /ORGANISM="Thalassionema nitzschioides, Strain L26-B" /LENGTH=506 /DNA_ID=CAMNT_0038930525 /DNA_START=71 /DNA_END=1591 /DNA_ORIENTATION=+